MVGEKLMELADANGRQKVVEKSLGEARFVEFHAFERERRTLHVAFTQRLRKAARRAGVWVGPSSPGTGMNENLRQFLNGLDAATARSRLRDYRKRARGNHLVDSYSAEWHGRGVFEEKLRIGVDRFADRCEVTAETFTRSEHLDWTPAAVIRGPLSDNQWREIRIWVADAKFWQLPTKDNAAAGLDGEVWRIEGFEDGRFHFVERHSWSVVDGTGTEVFRLGRRLAHLAGITRFKDTEN
jgi:hypothetical protein